MKKTLVSGEEPENSIALHAEWMNMLREKYSFTEENADQIIQNEVGAVFERVLEDAGVFKRTPEGKEAFLRFTASVRA